MIFRLALLDVDGTLKREATWLPGALDLVRGLKAAGIEVALCSGREISALQAEACDLPGVRFLAGAGGAVVKERTGDGWRTLGDRFLPRPAVDHIADEAQRLGMEVWAYTHERWLVRERTDRVVYDESFTHAHATVGEMGGRDDVVKILLFCETPAQEAFRAEVASWDGIGVASSYPGYDDVLPDVALATKGGDVITQAAGCTWAQTIAAGDGPNDLGMLGHAGLAYLLAPRTAAELAHHGTAERVEVPSIGDVLTDLRVRGVLA